MIIIIHKLVSVIPRHIPYTCIGERYSSVNTVDFFWLGHLQSQLECVLTNQIVVHSISYDLHVGTNCDMTEIGLVIGSQTKLQNLRLKHFMLKCMQ